jgi:hypothetical protein
MVIPNSFLCLKNVKPMYDEGTSSNIPFVCEKVDNLNVTTTNFMPGMDMMGSLPNNGIIHDMIEHIDKMLSTIHVQSEHDFMYKITDLCNIGIKNGDIHLIGGEMIGIKCIKHNPILIEDILSDKPLALIYNPVGIYIPSVDILKRSKYQWFAVLPPDQILSSNMIISKYIISSNIDCENKSSIIKSVVSV